MRIMLFYALISLGLLLDGAYLFRIMLFCCFVHELGHVVMYVLCTKKLPKIEVSAGGVCLKRTQHLTKAKKALVLISGPGSNLLMFLLMYLQAQQKATYEGYIIAAVNLCICVYNLLPLAALDGAQLVELFLPIQCINAFQKFQTITIAVLVVLMPIFAFKFNLPVFVVLGAFIAPVYLLLQNTL